MNIKIKDILKSERPRERLISTGVENLSNTELLSILLKTGTKDISVKELSNCILKELDSFLDLRNINIEKLKKIKGIGDAKACELIAAIELGKRLNYKYDDIKKIKVISAQSIFEYYKNIFEDKKQEYFYTIYLDTKNNIIKDKLLFIGTINQSLVHPREIFKEAYLLSASSIILIHNHPTGNVSPSKNDIDLTINIKNIGNILGIKVLDHIIIGSNDYYSFINNGVI